jgi:hypothetical protein
VKLVIEEMALEQVFLKFTSFSRGSHHSTIAP